MIRTYTVSELEEMSGFTRRTICDYVSKGLLSGPSHRGRGARYPQTDVDLLRLIPRLRTLMKREFPNLKALSEFLHDLSGQDLRRLARKTNERALETEVRRLRIRNSMIAMLPTVAPERIDMALEELTPEQICGVDAGRFQIGAVLDVLSLAAKPEALEESEPRRRAVGDDNSVVKMPIGGRRNTASAPQDSAMPELYAASGGTSPRNDSGHRDRGNSEERLHQRMHELGERLERLERLLEFRTK